MPIGMEAKRNAFEWWHDSILFIRVCISCMLQKKPLRALLNNLLKLTTSNLTNKTTSPMRKGLQGF
jgi:hypothetical protein